MRSGLRKLGYATRLSTGASREAPVDKEWSCKLSYANDAVRSRLHNLGYATMLSGLCNLSYAIYAVQSRLCNLAYATRLSTGASREAPVDNEWLCKLGYAIDAV